MSEPSAETEALVQELNREHEALSTEDCTAACRALASIKRATERLCALDPGPPCQAARAKERSATERVREACPDCAVALTPPKEREPVVAAEAQRPPAESARGGCAGCVMAPAYAPSPSDVLSVAAILIALARRARKKRF